MINEIIPSKVPKFIRVIMPPRETKQGDCMQWGFNKNEKLSTKITYDMLDIDPAVRDKQT
ncbi:hypothetical protein Syun_007223 [Stephania yunnanensis]|uniref:Uncharacterized protein n=1 Tax=Stephania yunnanensis TaxID=152371 RepID=A0AAP0PYB9_9MAGN